MPDEIESIPQYLNHLKEIPVGSIRQGSPNKDEIRSALKKLKNGKKSSIISPNLSIFRSMKPGQRNEYS